MSRAHLFHSSDGLVAKCLRGLVSYNPSLSVDETNRVVFDTHHDRAQVSLVSGGGSGHEPAWAGYVGENMLAAAVGGDIFASPSTKQILAALEAVPSDKGSILVVTNYTGDCLHFGLANEKAIARGHRCRMIVCGDDVSVGRTGGRLVGRRGLAGQIGVLKVMGGAAGQGGSLDDVYDLGVAFSQQIVSMAATLDHCHVPGRAEHATLGDDEVEIGTGPHNEPGYQSLSPAPSAEALVRQLLAYCLDEQDPERGYVTFHPDDEVFLLVSNFGGLSNLEMGALTDELLGQLATTWKLAPVRVYVGPLETSLNAPAFSVSLVNATQAAARCGYTVEQIKAFADVRTTTSWEAMAGCQGGPRRPRREQWVQAPADPPKVVDDARDLKMDPEALERMLRGACQALLEAEPDLTKWDTILGDGDCGETLRNGATSLLTALDTKKLAATGSVVAVLHELEDIVESRMGGTLGGILGLFFVSLRNAVERNVWDWKQKQQQQKEDDDDDDDDATGVLWGISLATALDQLAKYTPAKVGDRTVMDTLIPFAEAIRKAGRLDKGLDAAIQGAEATRGMRPRLGRATYVAAGREAEKGGTHGQLPPDPGAWAAMVAIQGLKGGM